MAFSGVRYLRLSVDALKIISLQDERNKAQFVDFLLTCYNRLERGEELERLTDDTAFNIAVNNATTEIVRGFDTYMRNVGNGKAVLKQCRGSGGAVHRPYIKEETKIKTDDEPVRWA